VLCIAVLHHISTVERRLQLLRELARVLKPGGQGIVTVWATEQEDPVKTIKKWALIKEGTGQQVLERDTSEQVVLQQQHQKEVEYEQQHQQHQQQQHQQHQQQDQEVEYEQQQQQQQQQVLGDATLPTLDLTEGHLVAGAAAGNREGPVKTLEAPESHSGGEGVEADGGKCDCDEVRGGGEGAAASAAAVGPDYLVPWHVPFHRAGTLAKHVAQQEQQKQQMWGGGAETGAGGAAAEGTGAAGARRGVGAAAGAPRVDATKGAVVYQRYYHLFEEGELQGLVALVTGVKLVDAFYDRSNWCGVFEKLTA
jgi:hypothetical protein